MANSHYLARLIGPPLVVIAVSMLLDRTGYVALSQDVIDNPTLIYIAAAIALFPAVALVLAHNVWSADWRVLITLLGWVAVIDCVSWIFAHRQLAAFWSPLLDSEAWPLIGGAVTLLIGAVLCYFGYVARRPA